MLKVIENSPHENYVICFELVEGHDWKAELYLI